MEEAAHYKTSFSEEVFSSFQLFVGLEYLVAVKLIDH
jgi:hypothetical protein